jgi:glycosyltransferase involved in cell wall biosynthesis
MKLLHVTSDWKWTGPAEPMLHAVCGLRERGHEVDLAAPAPPGGAGPGLLERAEARGVVPVLRLASAQGYRPLRDRSEVARLRALVAERGYALVHVHHTRDFLLCRRALRGTDVRLVASWHHGEPIAAWPWNRWLWGSRSAHALVVLSERIRRAAIEELGWSGERAAAIPGVVDTDRFTPRAPSPEVAASLGIGPQHRVLGIVARLQPHRRFELLLEAVDRLRRERPEFRLLVVGRGTHARRVLEEPVARLGLGDVVIRAGYRRDDYLDVLALMHGLVFLVPGSDGSCRAVLEAMGMGIPAIATRRGVLPETVEDGKTGRLVDETPESLLGALRELCAAPEAWAARGRAARDHVVAQHRIEQYAERLERVYRGLVEP